MDVCVCFASVGVSCTVVLWCMFIRVRLRMSVCVCERLCLCASERLGWCARVRMCACDIVCV